MGPSGDTPLKTTLKGFQAIDHGSTLYFQGKVHKKGEHVKVLAEKFYVEN